MRSAARFVSAFALLACLPLLAACHGGSGNSGSTGAYGGASHAAAPAQPVTYAPATYAPAAPSYSGGGGGGGSGVVFDGKDMPLEQVLARSRATGKPVMLYFHTTWCGYCRKLERETLPNPEVGRHMAGYVNVEYGADAGVGRDLAQRYGVKGFPTLVRIDSSGKTVGFYEGFDQPADFVRRIPAP